MCRALLSRQCNHKRPSAAPHAMPLLMPTHVQGSEAVQGMPFSPPADAGGAPPPAAMPNSLSSRMLRSGFRHAIASLPTTASIPEDASIALPPPRADLDSLAEAARTGSGHWGGAPVEPPIVSPTNRALFRVLVVLAARLRAGSCGALWAATVLAGGCVSRVVRKPHEGGPACIVHCMTSYHGSLLVVRGVLQRGTASSARGSCIAGAW